LGKPVVPDVYMMKAVAAGSTSAGRRQPDASAGMLPGRFGEARPSDAVAPG